MPTFLIHCPGDSEAGGVESLHQLGDGINKLNEKAYMCYYPYEESFSVPAKFNSYKVKPSKFFDGESVIHIFPEIFTKAALKIKKGKVGIFWLSIDNYFGKKDHHSNLKNFFQSLRLLYKTRLPIFKMKSYFHLYQSRYSKDFLRKYDLNGFYIGDYIKKIPKIDESIKKEKIILFNPKKGRFITDVLIKKNKDFKFIPLINLKEYEIFELMKKSMIYIDFGNHPGRDRIPREAVINGCIIITGRRGSSVNDEDIPIDKKYKIDHKSESFHRIFKNLCNDIFENYEIHQEKMKNYLDAIKENEKYVIQNIDKFLKGI